MKRSRISEVLSGLIDLIVAGLLWLVCSLPVITIGASTTALYYAVNKTVRHNRGRLTPTFFSGFRSNFRQATLIWLLMLGYILVGLLDAYAIRLMGFRAGTVPYVLSFLFFLPPFLLFPWVFAFISRFQNSVIGTLKYCAWLALRHLKTTLILAVELFLFLLICWLLPALIPFFPSSFCMMMSLSTEPVFRQLQQETRDDSLDPWYNE